MSNLLAVDMFDGGTEATVVVAALTAFVRLVVSLLAREDSAVGGIAEVVLTVSTTEVVPDNQQFSFG